MLCAVMFFGCVGGVSFDMFGNDPREVLREGWQSRAEKDFTLE